MRKRKSWIDKENESKKGAVIDALQNSIKQNIKFKRERRKSSFLCTRSKNLIDRRASITAPRKQREEKQYD